MPNRKARAVVDPLGRGYFVCGSTKFNNRIDWDSCYKFVKSVSQKVEEDVKELCKNLYKDNMLRNVVVLQTYPPRLRIEVNPQNDTQIGILEKTQSELCLGITKIGEKYNLKTSFGFTQTEPKGNSRIKAFYGVLGIYTLKPDYKTFEIK